MRCPYCGTEINGGAFCSKCGKRIIPPQQVPVQPVGRYGHAAAGSSVNKGLVAAVICLGIVLVIVAAVFVVKVVAPGNKMRQIPVSPAGSQEMTEQGIPGAEDNAVAVEEATPEPRKAPEFPYIEVSSTRGTDTSSRGEVVDYHKSYLTDGIFENCWTPDRRRDSSPWFILRADTPQYVTGIRFTDGYFKSYETYNRNRRISRVEIVYNGGSMIYDCPEHVFGQMQDVVFPAPVETDFIRVNVLSTLYGDWLDICVSEVEVY